MLKAMIHRCAEFHPALSSIGLSLTLGLAIALVGCGEDSTTTTTLVEIPPQINQLVFPNPVLAQAQFTVSHQVSVPGALPATDTAASLSWSFPNGPTIVTQQFSATQIGCFAGAISCTGEFITQAPTELTVFDTDYEVVFTVFDRRGQRAEQTRTVNLLLSPPGTGLQ